MVDHKAATLLKALRSIKSVYINKNIFIKTLFMDNEFEVLRHTLQDEGITLNTASADEHVPQIERHIKVVKERVCSTWNSLPYKKSSYRMISRMVENTFFWLKALAKNSGTSSTISPQTLMTGTTIDFSKHYKIEFGAYAEAQKRTFLRNSTQSRT